MEDTNIQIATDNESGSKKETLDSYETIVTLPTKGILYKNDNIPSDITLRGMTTRDEKILYATPGEQAFKKILRNCIINPKDININKLIASDEMFLILSLRMVTYGDNYKVSARCPNCGNIETYDISLSSFKVNYLDDDFEEPIIIELPKSKDTLSIRLLRNEDTDFVQKYARKFAKQFNQNERETEYICRMAKYIQKINDKSVDFIEAKDYVENMYSLDSAKFWTVLNKIKVGVDTTITETCPMCGNTFDFLMPITSEFFRPHVE